MDNKARDQQAIAICVNAFKEGKKLVARQLLSRISQPATITTTFFGFVRIGPISKVSLLHLAAYWGWIDVVTELVSVHGCSIDCKDNLLHIPLHYAASQGHLEVTKYFLDRMGSLPLGMRNLVGYEPLHLACHYGQVNIIQYLINEAHCDLSCVTRDGLTPLHIACVNGQVNVVQYLINTAHCDPSCLTTNGRTPLHEASLNGQVNVVQYLINEAHCDPSCVTNDGKTPLHYACVKGHVNVVQYLINEALCDPSCVTNDGRTPLHIACRYGHLNIILYLIIQKNCNPSCVTSDGKTPLHVACRYGHFSIVVYLIKETHCDPSCVTSDGWTPLHYACINHHTNTVQRLLSTGRVNPLAKDESGRTALQNTNNFEIIRLFEPFVECSTAYPVHTFTKLILTGDSGAGKTSLTELIVCLATHSSTAIECVADVQCFTAGIVPHHIQSELGNFVVYDFAGQQEYYSSHAAVLEHVMQKSAVMFLCLVDLSKSNESICQSLHYWLSFINNACCSVAIRSHVAIIGSHSDLIESASDKEKEKSSLIQAMAARRIKKQEFAGYLSMDCRHMWQS